MKEVKLSIEINKPVSDVFAFTTDPKNTSLWVSSIVHEETNEWPVKLGTIYRNRGESGEWSEYEVTDYKENEMFVFKKRNSFYHVRYDFASIGTRGTRLIYTEWVDEGEIDDPFTQEILEKLKQIMESSV